MSERVLFSRLLEGLSGALCIEECWERSTAKNYYRVSFLSLVSKVFVKLVNKRTVDRLEECGVFPEFQYGFRSSRSTVDHLTVVSDRIVRVFKSFGATRAVTLDISNAFDRVWNVRSNIWLNFLFSQ